MNLVSGSKIIIMIKAKIKTMLLTLSGDFRHLRYKKFSFKKQWYGNGYGGFYVVPQYLNEHSIIYSFGIGEDISFDKELILRHNCLVYGFDPTPKSIKWIRDQQQSLSNNFVFCEYGIGIKSGKENFFLPKNTSHVSGSFINQINVNEMETIEVYLKSFKDITSEFGHQTIDILKMDIEGAEYLVLDDILNSDIQINQILIEFHDRFFADGRDRTIAAINKLNVSGFELYGVSDTYEEISFINRKILP